MRGSARFLVSMLFGCGASVWFGCGGSIASQYGYARQYEALDAEEAHLERAVDVSYEDVRRDPEAHGGKLLGWFGKVTHVERLASGRWRVSFEQRFHQPRHLCRDHAEDSCRVTITKRVGGPFSTELSPHHEDLAGKYRLQPGALVKLYGRPTGEFDDDGGPILESVYYRHWPLGTFVRIGAAGAMRR